MPKLASELESRKENGMDDRVAIVTGGAQGVGLATAQRFAEDGIRKFVLVDMNGEVLKSALSLIKGTGAEAHGFVGDLSKVSNCEKAVKTAIDAFGQVDILANCAGNTARGGILDTSEAAFDGLFGVNVKAPFYMIQNAAKEMLKRKTGVIINISSMLAHGGPPMLLTYSATKAALVTITKSAANTFKRDGIRVFAINLGWTVTPHEHQLQTKFHNMPEDWAQSVGRAQPFGRLLVPDDPAGVMSFLISKDASMMTGVVIDLEQFVIGTTEAALGAVEL
jgi:NAD(P)-dependent dehydrogenase (short-subunit alcohol dehydrogenase family)